MSSEFDIIIAFHKKLSSQCTSREKAEANTILKFIENTLKKSKKVTAIEDREELRYILRFWGSYLTSQGLKFPDIDIDSSGRKPKNVTIRRAPWADSPHYITGSVHELESFEKRLNKLSNRDIKAEAFTDLLNQFNTLLPGAINDIVQVQRRSRIDVLSDASWSIRNNVLELKELIEDQGTASDKGLRELWVSARRIFDLNPEFYTKTVRKNLLDKVQHCYFVKDVSQFSQLYHKVGKDKKLGREHLDYLSCITISGDYADLFFLFDYALRNPSEFSNEGKFVYWDLNRPRFYPFMGRRAEIATKVLDSIKKKVLKYDGEVKLENLNVKLEERGRLN